MNPTTLKDLQEQAQYISFLINEVGKRKLFPYFTNFDVVQLIRQRNLHQFLLNIPSHQLRRAAQQRQQRQDQQVAERAAMKYNVLNFTLSQLVRHCWDNRIIDYNHYKNQLYTLDNFYELAMRLVDRFPHKYQVGKRSNHFNHSREIQKMFGINRDRDQENDEQQNFGNQQEQQEQQENRRNSEISQEQFINDQVSQSNYEDSNEEQLHQQDDEQDEDYDNEENQDNLHVKKKNKKIVKKNRLNKNKGMKKIQNKKERLRKIQPQDDQQQQNKNKVNNQQIYQSSQEIQIQIVKNLQKTKQKEQQTSRKKRNQLDSQEEN